MTTGWSSRSPGPWSPTLVLTWNLLESKLTFTEKTKTEEKKKNLLLGGTEKKRTRGQPRSSSCALHSNDRNFSFTFIHNRRNDFHQWLCVWSCDQDVCRSVCTSTSGKHCGSTRPVVNQSVSQGAQSRSAVNIHPSVHPSIITLRMSESKQTLAVWLLRNNKQNQDLKPGETCTMTNTNSTKSLVFPLFFFFCLSFHHQGVIKLHYLHPQCRVEDEPERSWFDLWPELVWIQTRKLQLTPNMMSWSVKLLHTFFFSSVATGIVGNIVLVSIVESVVVVMLTEVVALLRSLLAKWGWTSSHKINIASKASDGPNFAAYCRKQTY